MSKDGLFTPHTCAAVAPTDAALLPRETSTLADVAEALNRAADAQVEANALLSEAYDKLGQLTGDET